MGELGLRTARRAKVRDNYHTYLASEGQLPYTPSVECAVAICRLRHARVRKHTRISLLLRTASHITGRHNPGSYPIQMHGYNMSFFRVQLSKRDGGGWRVGGKEGGREREREGGREREREGGKDLTGNFN